MSLVKILSYFSVFCNPFGDRILLSLGSAIAVWLWREERAIAVLESLKRRTNLAVNFSLIMSDVITEVLSSLLTGKAIN
jgi:hypothetical protein